MSLASFLQRTFGSAPSRPPLGFGNVAPKPGRLGTWVRKHPFRFAFGWGLILIAVGFLPLDGITRPKLGPDALVVAPKDRARIAPAIQTCLNTDNELRETCPALEQARSKTQ